MYQVQKQKGITLIALVIMIIIIVLLAGVAINLAIGENGILNNAKNSKELTIKQNIKEEIEESILAIQVEEITKTGKLTLEKLYEELPKQNTNVKIEEHNEVELKGTYAKDGKIYSFTIDKDFNVIIGEQEEQKALTFEEIQWTNGKASITITSKISNSIEYQVNATNEGSWIQGNAVANLNNGDIVYARINDGTTITEIQQKEIKDEIKPEEFEITVPEDGVTYESINVVTTGTTDNQTGLATYSYIAATSSNQIVKEITGQTVTEYTINELSPETEYVVYMLAYDNAGNVRKSNEVVVGTEKIPITEMFGQYVDYPVSIDDDESDYDWKIFYIEEDESSPNYGATYIIADYVAEIEKMETSMENANLFKYNDSGTRMNYAVATKAFNEYKAVSQNVRKVFLYNVEESNTVNSRICAQLLDTEAWEEDFLTNDLKQAGGLAVGASTIELFIKSWNKLHNTNITLPKVIKDNYRQIWI